MNPATVIFIGRSGCGKGTQAKLLLEELTRRDAERPITYVETGESFRQFLKEDSFSSELSREIYKEGELQPEFLAVYMWAKVFVQELKGGEHLVLDGVPRKLREALVLDSAFDFYSRSVPTVIHLDVSPEWSRERLRDRKRSDDVNEEEVTKRLAWFDTDVWPAIEWYRNDPGYRFFDVNAERSIEEIAEDVNRAVFERNNG